LRKNFEPLLSRPLPYYEELTLHLPPLLEVLEWSDRQQFDVIHVSTPGPMGLCGWLVAKMLRAPLVCTYHTDFPAYAERLTRDHRVSNGTLAYMKWFYSHAATVLSRSKAYRFKISDLGIAEEKIVPLSPAVDHAKFNPSRRDEATWKRLGVSRPLRILYAGRVSREKNLGLLIDSFARVAAQRDDVALVIAGDGPAITEMRQRASDLPVHFLGTQSDDDLAALYASADLFVFPSRTDTLGQAVMEAQASGLPAIVSNEGGPREVVEDTRTGLVIPHDDPARWAEAIHQLLDDAPARRDMGRLAVARASRWSPAQTFEQFLDIHLQACDPIAIARGAASPASKTLAGL
jgi:glycosyltransferase involved in cell wall biosynthesis